MAKIKFFNAFVLKKTVNSITSGRATYKGVFPGLPWNPSGYAAFRTSAVANNGRAAYGDNTKNWIIEEARIRGGFNNTSAGYGTRAYLREDSNLQSRRINSLIYSGIFNSRTEINDTNVFSVAEDITKSVDPMYGSIQKIHALDSNLAILQEDKVSRALIDKDAIYSAEGGGTVTSSNAVIGQVTPYVGEHGISKNPESFAYYGYRRYFTDKNRNSVMRLSRDGLTRISQYGMSDFFRDKFGEINEEFVSDSFNCVYEASNTTAPFYISVSGSNIDRIEKGMQVSIPQAFGDPVIANVLGIFNSVNIYIDTNPNTYAGGNVEFTSFVQDRIVGGWDVHNSGYVVSLQKQTPFFLPEVEEAVYYYTTSFDEDVLGWTSFYTYKPKFMSSLKNKFYSFYTSELYEHYNNESDMSSFYGVRAGANITFIFNVNPNVYKNFKTISYEGSNGWEVNSILSDFEGFDKVNGAQNQYQDSSKPVLSYDEGVYTDSGVEYRIGFNRFNNKYVANLRSNNTTRPGQVIINPNGENVAGIKGFYATVKISTDATTDIGGAKELFAVSSDFAIVSY